jgi:hypothetical protein
MTYVIIYIMTYVIMTYVIIYIMTYVIIYVMTYVIAMPSSSFSTEFWSFQSEHHKMTVSP